MLVVLVGVRGAGKSTALETLKKIGALVLVPSTTRNRRSPSDNEYDFVEEWKDGVYGWTITVGANKYGMRNAELAKAHKNVCVTVFDPLSIDTFIAWKSTAGVEVLTIGLDTVSGTAEQRRRVNDDSARVMSEEEFSIAVETVRKCDMVLRGGVTTIADALRACVELLDGRGGVVGKAHLSPLIAAGAIVVPSSQENIKPASYDLTIGDQVWCEGAFVKLTDLAPGFSIPAYSYAIVVAAESARLPPFMVGRFDVKVSYFLEGVILSNGPQIDPGYSGALFCMLFNASARPKLLTRGRHFATVDFTLTTKAGECYKQQYQFQDRMDRFMSDEAIVAPGGTILKLIDRKVGDVASEVSAIKTNFWVVASFVIAFAVIFPSITIPYLWSQMSSLQDKLKAVDDKSATLDRLVESWKSVNSERRKLQEEARNGIGDRGRLKKEKE